MTPKQLEKAAARINELQRLERIGERIKRILNGGQTDDDTRINIVFGRLTGIHNIDQDVLTEDQREAIVEYIIKELKNRQTDIKAEIKTATAASLIK
jgi:hypothetical protein